MLEGTAFTAYWGSVGLWGLSAFFVFTLFELLRRGVPDEDRGYMDPLGPRLRIVWPLIRIIDYYLCTNLPNSYLEQVDDRLQKTGVAYTLTAEQYVALRIVSAALSLLVVWILLLAINVDRPAIALLSPVLGFFLPNLWLRDMRRRREREVVLAMPSFLDFITMAVEAGLNLAGALQQGVDNAPAGALKNEFHTVLRDLRAGLTRAEALRRMSDRLEISEVTSFVSSIIQAERLGSSMGTVLRLQADQRREERFQRAEKMAMEAPVKLVFPLVVFIFPVTFVILAFPIVMRFMQSGAF